MNFNKVEITNYLSLPKDESLEKNEKTKLSACLQAFFEKGGTLQYYARETDTQRIKLNRDAVVYPVCSGGWCRSQALSAFLAKHPNVSNLVAPHAARYGWDPYNGAINREANREKERYPDEYPLFFKTEKQMRFGFEHDAKWQEIEKNPTPENLRTITQYYNDHYYGSSSDTKRIYIAFEKNAHVVMQRLCEANKTLSSVTVIAIDWADTMTKPPEELNTTPRSQLTYKLFEQMLEKLFETSEVAH